MPPKAKSYEFTAWEVWILDHERDACLFEVLLHAIWARREAYERGAYNYGECLVAMRSAESALEAIRDGRARGQKAWSKASVAIRKFTVAAECGAPSAVRFSRKRTKTKGR